MTDPQQEKFGEVAYFLGGAWHTKPEHWSMSDLMFKVKITQSDDGRNYTIDSFEMMNPSISQTSEPPKLVFSSGITVYATSSKMLAFSVNGKCLQLRGVDTALSNEINVYESVPPKHTTYRTTTFRTPERAQQVPVESTSMEILQQGDIPPPMYASTLTPLGQPNGRSGKAVLVGVNSLAKERASPIQVMLGLKSVWDEESSGGVYLLDYDLSCKRFVWEKKNVEILPRAHHSAMISADSDMLYVFGGVNYVTKVRYDNWSILTAIIRETFPDISLSGHSFCQVTDNKCIFVGVMTNLKVTRAIQDVIR